MARNNIYEYDGTNEALNTLIAAIDIDEHCNASNVNNALRTLMVHLRQMFEDISGYATAGGTADVLTLSASQTIAAYEDGMLFAFIVASDNATSTPTLNIDTVGAKKIRRHGDVAMVPGDMKAGMPAFVVYDASADAAAGAWLLINPYNYISAFAKTLIDDADAATMRTTLGLAIGTNVQAYDAELAALAALASAADRVPYFTGSGTASLATFTSFARTLVDDADAAAARATLGNPMPIGTVVDYAGTSAPTGWLFCYGQAVSRTTYALLFAVLSTTYGAGDGSTTFNLPDLRGRVIAGKDDMGGTSANRLTGTSGGLNGDNLGASGGSETHTLITAELASHSHNRPNGNTTPNGSGIASGGSQARVTGNVATDTAGSDQPHNNVQPTFILNKMIFAGA